MKPLEICDRIVRVHSNAGERVVIPFGGSGSEIVAAARLGRRVNAYETCAEYYAIIQRRLVGHGILSADVLPVGLDLVTGKEPEVVNDEPNGESGWEGAADGLARDGRNSSGFKGVYKQGTHWVAKAMQGGILKNLGRRRFDTAKEAAQCYAFHAASMQDENMSKAQAVKLARQGDGNPLLPVQVPELPREAIGHAEQSQVVEVQEGGLDKALPHHAALPSTSRSCMQRHKY